MSLLANVHLNKTHSEKCLHQTMYFVKREIARELIFGTPFLLGDSTL